MNKDQDTLLKSEFYKWWDGLHDARNDGHNADRAELARLRRLDLQDYGQGLEPNLGEALMVGAFRTLRQRVEEVLGSVSEDQERDLFVIAATLARIRTDDREHRTAAHALGGQNDADRVMKETRFLRLIRAETAADLFDQAKRLTGLLKQKAPVAELAISLFWWRHRPHVRRTWARAYYHLDQYEIATAAASPEPADAGV